MENHPIPQDVTHFQFKLIGDMTVKQFGFLAGGVILAWVAYSLPVTAFVRFPLIFVFAASGFSLAFFPLDGRPLDTMIGYFIKALFTPNQYVYHKVGRQILPTLAPIKKSTKAVSTIPQNQQLMTYLQTLPKAKNSLDEHENRFFNSLGLLAKGGIPLSTSPPTHPPKFVSVSEEDTKKEEKADPHIDEEKSLPTGRQGQDAILLQKELAAARRQEKTQPTQSGVVHAHQKVLELEQQLQDALTQKKTLEDQLLTLQKKLDAGGQQTFSPSALPSQTQNVHAIPASMGKATGAPVSTAPNVVTGIVKDARENILPGILIEVKDKEGNPVRAFKTNPLGQFASATPLLSGTYTISFEDPFGKHSFDTVEITANGTLLPPLEVISHDQREELRRMLFNKPHE